jgi:hypothetical protein
MLAVPTQVQVDAVPNLSILYISMIPTGQIEQRHEDSTVQAFLVLDIGWWNSATRTCVFAIHQINGTLLLEP